MTVAVMPAQIRSDNGPKLSPKQMQEFLTRILPDSGAGPVTIQKGFAKAYALRFEAFLQRTQITMANVPEALQKAQTLLQRYTLDPASRAILKKHLEALLSRATTHIARQTSAASHTAWMKAFASMQQMQLSVGFIQQLRSAFVTILSRDIKTMATTNLTAPQRLAFMQDVTRTLQSARPTLDAATWQALAEQLTDSAMSWFTAAINLHAPEQTVLHIRAAAELYALVDGHHGESAFPFQLHRIAEVYLRATFEKSDVRMAEPDKLRRVIPQLHALLKTLPDQNHAAIIRTHFFESIARETFPLHHIRHSCRDGVYTETIQRLQRAMAQFPELAPFIEAAIVHDVEFRTDERERTLRAHNYAEDFPQLTARLQALR